MQIETEVKLILAAAGRKNGKKKNSASPIVIKHKKEISLVYAFNYPSM